MKKLKLILPIAIFSLLLTVNSMAYTAELDPETSLGSYTTMGEFNTDGNYDGWDYAEIGSPSVSGGAFNGTHIGGYPHMAKAQGFTFQVGTIIETRIKYNSGSHGYVRFLPRIDGSENIYPGISGDTLTTQTDGEYHVYRFTLDSGDTIYFGNLTSARFNPDDGGASGNSWHIDYIRLADSTTPPPVVPTNPVPRYVDTQMTLALIHCDSVVTNQWPDDGATNCYVTPDDNSSGRPAAYPILNSSNVFNGVSLIIDNSTIPTFETNSPYSGDYLSFDGNDSIIVTNGWHSGQSMFMDLAFRLQGLPEQTPDNWMALLTTFPVKAYIRNNGDDTYGKLTMLVYDNEGSVAVHYVTVNKLLSSNVWYHLSFSVSNNNVKATVGNDSSGYATTTTTIPSLFEIDGTDVIIGNSWWVPSRSLKGDMDEIRWGIIVPEPTSLFAVILLGLGFLRRK